jgi:hypothetical protein
MEGEGWTCAGSKATVTANGLFSTSFFNVTANIQATA